MSPEQARGEAVDHHSDIFSLGVMFFEMVTGDRPFQGESAIELMSSVLKDPAPALTDIRPHLPRHLSRIIGRCLEKVPDDRYQTARDVFNELAGLREEVERERDRCSFTTDKARSEKASLARLRCLASRCRLHRRHLVLEIARPRGIRAGPGDPPSCRHGVRESNGG